VATTLTENIQHPEKILHNGLSFKLLHGRAVWIKINKYYCSLNFQRWSLSSVHPLICSFGFTWQTRNLFSVLLPPIGRLHAPIFVTES